MKINDGFIYDEEAALTDEDQRVLKGLKHDEAIDPITGRKAKKVNFLNKKKLSKHEMDEFFLDY